VVRGFGKLPFRYERACVTAGVAGAFSTGESLRQLFMGISVLGSDLSFFKDLQQQQAALNEEVIAALGNERERKVALSLGACLQKKIRMEDALFHPCRSHDGGSFVDQISSVF
jgi:hypothetical protein